MGDASTEKKSDCVKVAIRCRPLSSKEVGNSESSIVEMQENSDAEGAGGIVINDPAGNEAPATFAFDIVFGIKTAQEVVFHTVGKPALESTLTGYNGTIFAYGQTGSGKSWCMTGGPDELRGIIPRVNEELFEKIAREQETIPTRKFLVMCSFFEIYNEIIFDLLNPVQDRSKLGAGLQVKEHPVLGIYVKDLQEIVVDGAKKLEQLMTHGTKNRAVSSTMMNAGSSRSHSIFIIKVHQKDDEDKSKNVFAKLNLVDLAGSERQKGTGATGQTLKEGANINKSLSALGNVINALVESANGKKVFIPYRNSKLTRVLQESLGGNSLCTMLATLSPAACNYEETLSTLRYANRAKAIKVSATKNEEASQISRLNVEIEELKKKLAAAAQGGGGGGMGPMADEERAEIRAKYQTQLEQIEGMLSSTWEEKAKLSKAHEAQLSKAQEEQKRQEKLMEEEHRKRFRLLQEQNDLELSIRALLDTVQSLQSLKPQAANSDANSPVISPTNGTSHPCANLHSGELPRQWLQAAAAVGERADALKQSHTMALVFQGAFSEDLRLWIDGEEAADHAMRRTGARRALKKLETLRKECESLASNVAAGQAQARDFAAAVAQATHEWKSCGEAAVVREIREADSSQETQEGGTETERELPALVRHALEDVGRIMQLIEQQGSAQVDRFTSLTTLDMRPPAELILRGVSLLGISDAADDALLKSWSSEADAAAPAASNESGGSAAKPKEERPLQDWMPSDADGSVEGTEFVLMQLIALDTLNKKRTPQELLARPPPKFMHDVGILIRQATGFLPGLSDHWPDDREAKLDLLQHVSDTVCAAHGLDHIDFDPADVLKGKEVEKTLRLLQLLGIAAARYHESQQGGSSGADAISQVHRDRKKAEGMLNASDMPSALDVMSRCIHRAADLHELQRDRQEDGGNISPTRELESNYRALNERLEEETMVRTRLEDRLAEVNRNVDEARTILGERHIQLDESQRAASDSGKRKDELQRQVEVLRSGLLSRADEMASNSKVNETKTELENIAALLKEKAALKEKLAGECKRLTQQRIEADSEREAMEMDMKRMKLRIAEGLDHQQSSREGNEALLVLQAEKEKLDVKCSSLEDKLKSIAEADDVERKRENGVIEETKTTCGQKDESQMQVQVITEERDALRDGMDQLWQEKQRADEELENVSLGYTHLSDRLLEKSEESRELEEQLQQYENLLTMLRENYEKSRHSPIAAPLAPLAPLEQAAPAVDPLAAPLTGPVYEADPLATPLVAPSVDPLAVPLTAPLQPLAQADPLAVPLTGPPRRKKDDDAASSHYSDETFEEYNEDAET